MTWMSSVCTLNGQCSGICGETSYPGKRINPNFKIALQGFGMPSNKNFHKKCQVIILLLKPIVIIVPRVSSSSSSSSVPNKNVGPRLQCSPCQL